MFIKCRCFKAGSAGKSFCSETGSSEPPLPTHPAPSMPLLSFAALNLSGCSFWQRRTMLLCAEVPEGQSKRHCGGWEKRMKNEIQSASQVRLCAFVRVSEPAALLPLPPGKAELRDGGGASQPALCRLPLTREREIAVLAGTPRQAVPAQLASPAPAPRRRHGRCQQALAPPLR